MKDGLFWLSQVSAAVLVFHSKKILVAINAAFSGEIVIGSTLFRRKSSLHQHISADLTIIHLSVSFSCMSRQSPVCMKEKKMEKRKIEKQGERENS